MQRPSALGLFVCERVIVNRDAGCRTLSEMFDEVVCARFPYTLRRFDMYSELTDGLGRITLDLVITFLETDQRIAAHRTTVLFPNPLVTGRIRFHFPAFVFSEAGVYLFEILAGGEAICHRRVTVTAREEES